MVLRAYTRVRIYANMKVISRNQVCDSLHLPDLQTQYTYKQPEFKIRFYYYSYSIVGMGNKLYGFQIFSLRKTIFQKAISFTGTPTVILHIG